MKSRVPLIRNSGPILFLKKPKKRCGAAEDGAAFEDGRGRADRRFGALGCLGRAVFGAG